MLMLKSDHKRYTERLKISLVFYCRTTISNKQHTTKTMLLLGTMALNVDPETVLLLVDMILIQISVQAC